MHSTSLTVPLLLYCSFVDALNLWRMYSKVLGVKGFTQSRWDALLGYWSAVCRHGPCGLISSLHPCDDWIPADLQVGF